MIQSPAEMGLFRTRRMRLIFALALAQLAVGPLVLLQVTFFCKLTLHEIPRLGIAGAASQVWSSPEFEAVLSAKSPVVTGEKKGAPPSRDSKLKPGKEKSPAIAWHPERAICVVKCMEFNSPHRDRVWTPAWPQAPPGPPPRVG